MWFDVQQALVEIDGRTPPTSMQSPVQDSAQIDMPHVAVVASVATLANQKPEFAKDAGAQHLHGVCFAGLPRTWTGRVVSQDEWRMLTVWERHGPNGQYWNGITKQWEHPRGSTNGQK